MKRATTDVVGRPCARDFRREVAGVSPISSKLSSRPAYSAASYGIDVASFRYALDDPMGTAERDAAWMAEFNDFMSGGEAVDHELVPSPDPIFREQLRRRLWRTHVLTRLRDGGETH